PCGPGRRAAGAELGLGVDDGGDQRGVEVLGPGLLADDVLVAQRQRDLAHRLLAQRQQEDGGQAAEDEDRSEHHEAPAPSHLRAHALSIARIADKFRCRSSTAPSLRTAWSARRAFSSWGSWRATRSSTASCPRPAARRTRPSPTGTTRLDAATRAPIP